METLETLQPWEKIHIPHEKRKYPNPLVHQSRIALRDYEGEIRQIVFRGNGREEPAFLISNDFDSSVELLVSDYARRWRVENVISEVFKFFHLNALSSPILRNIPTTHFLRTTTWRSKGVLDPILFIGYTFQMVFSLIGRRGL